MPADADSGSGGEWRALKRELRPHFLDPLRPLEEDRFHALALAAFRFQYLGSEVYRRFCDGRGATPDRVTRWQDVPAVPATAFKHLDLGATPGVPEAVFLTSGTTAGSGRRGRHPVPSLSLYRAAAVPWFGAHLVPEGGRLPVLALVPSPDRAPTSSLSTMMGFAIEAFGSAASGFFADAETGVAHDAFQDALRDAEHAGEAVLVMGTAFAWVHWLEHATAHGVRVRLPEGSRLMETGGFKGRSRAVPRGELYRELSARLGIPQARMVNEYGMTELLSQLYEPVLRAPGGPRVHRAPPWMRVRALDPETLAPRAPGDSGILAFHDLANVGSVCAVLTEDLGSVDDEGVHLEGRIAGAEPRGCSLAMESLLGEGR
ncbi:MAG: hypothetical protein RQ751_09835 [Longimicrobiales bacterium]|nr:hypothetical protein [Longimicrobiales bacterium]